MEPLTPVPVMDHPTPIYSSLWRRLGAWIFDDLVVAMLFGLLLYGPLVGLREHGESTAWMGSLYTLGWGVVVISYSFWAPLGCIKRFGGTPGDLVFRQRVRSQLGSSLSVTYLQLLKRVSVYFVIDLLSIFDPFVKSSSASESESLLKMAKKAIESLGNAESLSVLVKAIILGWFVIEVISVLSDRQKRSVSDRLGGVYVERIVKKL